MLQDKDQIDPSIDDPGVNSGVFNELVGYCEKCICLQNYKYELNNELGWGNTCQECKTFVPLSEFNQAILLCAKEDIVYSLDKTPKTLTKELLIKLTLIVEKLGEMIISKIK
jgi:hypothetical protein